MKKKLLSIISIFVAMLMCFAFVACNETTEPTPTPDVTDKNELPADKTLEAINTLLSAHGYSVAVKATVNSEKTEEPIVIDELAVKKGDVFKVLGDDENAYIDCSTGYAYYEQDGEFFYYEQVIPTGYVDYLKDVVDGLLPKTDEEKLEFYEKLQDVIEYDAATKTGTYFISLKEIVNFFFTPLQNSYKNGTDTVLDLIDMYIAVFVSNNDYKSLDAILTYCINHFDDIKDITLGEILLNSDNELGISVKDILALTGNAPPEEYLSAVESRTVGEALTAVTDYITAKLGESLNAGSIGEIDPSELIAAALFAPVDPADIAKTPAKLRMIKVSVLLILNSITVKDAVDLSAGSLPPDLYLFISKEIKFKKLQAKIGFTFDDDYNFSKITVDGEVAHNYTSTPNDNAEFFSDNNYTVDAAFDIYDYTDEGEYTLAAPEREENPGHVEVAVVVRADSNALSYDFYYEEGSEITVSDYAFYNVAGEPYEGMDNAVTYDAATKTFSVKASALSPVFSAENFYTEQGGVVLMTAIVEYSEGETYVLNVKFYVFKDASVDSALSSSIPMLADIFGGSNGDFEEYPDVDFQPEE